MKNKKIVAVGRWWACENLDALAPITEQGIAFLYLDGKTDFFKLGEEPNFIQWADEKEKRQYGNGLGIVYRGDIVTITKGRFKGQEKTVNGFFTFTIPNTYGKAYTDYLTFDDGTKTNILNCEINGIRARKFDEKPIFHCGGRI